MSDRTCRTKRTEKQKRAFKMYGDTIMANYKPNISKIKDPALKEKWVQTLRSGTYIQGKGKLKRQSSVTDKDQFCCLGVLCDILAPDGWTHNSYSGDEHTFTGKSKQQIFPNERKMIELGIYPSTMKKLGTMNDDENKSFSEIADYIENHL